MVEDYKITSVHRDDLEIAGFDSSNLADATMERLADKMASAYIENSFWVDLELIAKDMGILKKTV